MPAFDPHSAIMKLHCSTTSLCDVKCEMHDTRASIWCQDTMSCGVLTLAHNRVDADIMESILKWGLQFISSGEINAVLVVAPHAIAFPQYGAYHLGTMHDVPCAFVAQCAQSEDRFEIATESLKSFWAHFKAIGFPSEDQVETSRLMATIAEMRKNLKTLQTHSTQCVRMLSVRKKSASDTIRRLEEEESLINADSILLNKMICTLGPELELVAGYEQQDEATHMEKWELVNRIVAQRLRDIEVTQSHEEEMLTSWPTRARAGVTETEARKHGGYKTLLTAAMNHHSSRPDS